MMAGLFCFLVGEANAQDKKGTTAELPSLVAVDADSDGVVTSGELSSYLRENHFDDWSAKVELNDLTDEQREKLFVEDYLESWTNKIDANENGKISKWEFRLAFESLDRVIVEKNEEAERESKAAENEPPKSSIEAMNMRFQSKKPALGTLVEDLVAIDEDGEEVDLAELRDKHVVIVFGCLT
jgi:hypothetical protein